MTITPATRIATRAIRETAPTCLLKCIKQARKEHRAVTITVTLWKPLKRWGNTVTFTMNANGTITGASTIEDCWNWDQVKAAEEAINAITYFFHDWKKVKSWHVTGNNMVNGYYGPCHITGTVAIEHIIESARKKGTWLGSFIDETGYGERSVRVAIEGERSLYPVRITTTGRSITKSVVLLKSAFLPSSRTSNIAPPLPEYVQGLLCRLAFVLDCGLRIRFLRSSTNRNHSDWVFEIIHDSISLRLGFKEEVCKCMN